MTLSIARIAARTRVASSPSRRMISAELMKKVDARVVVVAREDFAGLIEIGFDFTAPFVDLFRRNSLFDGVTILR